jgi:hypothetical protein
VQRVWLVVVLGLLFTGCQERGIPGDLKVVHDGCERANSSAENKAIDVAEEYFRREVGVPVKEVRFGYVSICKDIFVVPVSAISGPSPIASIWYVEVSVDVFRPLTLERPM